MQVNFWKKFKYTMHACFNKMNIVLILCENCVFYALNLTF